MAPELKGKLNVQYSTSVDVYGYGVLMVELFTGKLGYDANYSVQQNDMEEARNLLIENVVTKTDFTSFIGRLNSKKLVEPLRYLISECLYQNPELRPPFSQVIAVLERIRKASLIVEELENDEETENDEEES